jgi:septal ring factor EnvC (AmiA/AmiB activator)
MNNYKNVLKHLKETKVELETQKVELGAIDDLDAEWKAASRKYGEVSSLVRKANQTLSEMLKEFQAIEKKGKKISAQLRELGVEDKDFTEVMRKVARDKGAILDTKKRNIGSF